MKSLVIILGLTEAAAFALGSLTDVVVIGLGAGAAYAAGVLSEKNRTRVR